MGLGDLSIVAIEAAVHRAMVEKKFFPTVAELRELAGELTPADRSVIAWKALLDAHEAHGYYGSVDFDDKAINAAVHALGGWEKFSERLDEEGRVWIGKEFDRIYQVYCRRGVTPREALPLGGFHSRHNAAKGLHDHIPKIEHIVTGLKPALMLSSNPTPTAAIAAAATIAQAASSIGGMP